MKPPFDFSRTPRQRRRQRELEFYRRLAAAALLGCLLAALPGLRVAWHTASLRQANALLTEELQTLAPQVQQAGALRTRLASLDKQLKGQEQLARQRRQASLLLRAAAQASSGQTRLQRIVLQPERGELRGHATSAQAVQEFATAVAAAGLEQAALQELHAEDGGYAFSLLIPLPLTQPGPDPARGPR
ncbi:MAG TPA: pilus assembly protein [Herbaspirillum sp.]|uniref:pilus assembly protein n=1 Tax=Herbaspirillum sp. TaxID=1890675 RepID=UPI002D5D9C63|nr:pilus assembly protein [Herbaspirillum sp.]HZG20416.1 pilus assembly protein [Herbaspirillum sp.]